MTDPSTLTADQLAEKVHGALYYGEKGGSLALGELVRRASERDQAEIAAVNKAGENARRRLIAEARAQGYREALDRIVKETGDPRAWWCVIARNALAASKETPE